MCCCALDEPIGLYVKRVAPRRRCNLQTVSWKKKPAPPYVAAAVPDALSGCYIARVHNKRGRGEKEHGRNILELKGK